MEDLLEIVGGAAGVEGGDAGGGAAAGGGGALGAVVAEGGGALGAAGAGGGAGARDGDLCTTHTLAWLCGNRNSGGQGSSSGKMLVLAKKQRVPNEAVNFQNQKLTDIYNEVWRAGDLYVDSKKGFKNKQHISNLQKNFNGLVSKLKNCQDAVVEAGGQPVKFPSHVFEKLPPYYQDVMKEAGVV